MKIHQCLTSIQSPTHCQAEMRLEDTLDGGSPLLEHVGPCSKISGSLKMFEGDDFTEKLILNEIGHDACTPSEIKLNTFIDIHRLLPHCIWDYDCA